eukprot:6210836-Pleurochrysis_carterae.AAC.3
MVASKPETQNLEKKLTQGGKKEISVHLSSELSRSRKSPVERGRQSIQLNASKREVVAERRGDPISQTSYNTSNGKG